MILVLNAGGSSLKFALFGKKQKKLISGKLKNKDNVLYLIYTSQNITDSIQYEKTNQNQLLLVLDLLKAKGFIRNINQISSFVLRVVFSDLANTPMRLLDDQLYADIKNNIDVCPVHNQLTINLIDQIKNEIKDPVIMCVFDSYFFTKMKQANKMLPIKQSIARKFKLYKRGFHGISYDFALSSFIKKTKINKPNLVMVHLGSGASVCLVKNGVATDVSMSYSPLSGLMMKNRCGDLDPSVLVKLCEQKKWTIQKAIEFLNTQAGFLTLCNQDIDQIIAKEKLTRNEKIVLEIFLANIQKYLLLYLNQLDHVDGIIFMGGVCEHNPQIINMIVNSLKLLRLSLVPFKFVLSYDVVQISTKRSQFPIYLIQTDENKTMAKYANIYFNNIPLTNKTNSNQQDEQELNHEQ